jgi:glutamate dehydrogenase
VLAALAFSEEDFPKYMTPDKDGKFPEFYQTYVDEIIERVESNARNEFEIIWAMN